MKKTERGFQREVGKGREVGREDKERKEGQVVGAGRWMCLETGCEWEKWRGRYEEGRMERNVWMRFRN